MKKLLWIIPLAVHFAYLGQNMFRSFVKIDRLKSEQQVKLREKNELENVIIEYNDMIKNINDPFYREKIARNKLQMISPGEKIYRLIETN
ncbi:septum formation initiator family protein [uncultured Cetobacterium sp.]|uniref:septum formation initiator family protein n=1 Tax=uncultured Cetobacterium sp. TaxID=527638 RepID=UPI002609D434|nr:septum formation initiator family protein [uncultured Cetobacterium sp.]